MARAAQAIHGIGDADLIDAPIAAEVLPEFLTFLGDPATTTLLAHNAAFDAGFVGRELGRISLAPPGHAIVDTLALVRSQVATARNHRLDTMARLLGLNTDGAHRALGDSLRVMGIWLALRGAELPETTLVSFPIFDPRGPVPAPNGWSRLTDAIAVGRRVRMEYLGGSRGSDPREVTPLGFVHRGGVAFLLAHCHLDAYQKSFRLDRVRRYEVVELAAIPSPDAIPAG
jgi:hypothetical protein